MNQESDGSPNEYSFSQVADAYLEMHREGRAPGIRDMAETFPHLASEILEKLPAIKMLEGALGSGTYPKVDRDRLVAGCLIREEIGRGACGIVYRASQPELDREVAVKVIRLQSKTTRRFEVERHAMARLDHPNIVPVYSFEQADSQAYLVMKLIDGFSFEQLLQGKCDHHGLALLAAMRSDWTLFAKIALDIVDGLEHAHKHSLVHRDIKPGNLMLDRQGHVWIADFGLVKTFDHSQSLSATGDLIGTPRYMSPEQLRGTCDARSDIYALGLSLYELATGEKARQLQSQQPEEITQDLGSSNSSGGGVNAPEMPESLVAIIQKASAFAPEDRFQSATELKHVLQRFIDNQVPDRRKGRRKSDAVFRREFRRNIVVATVASALIGGLGYLSLFPTSPPGDIELTPVSHVVRGEDNDPEDPVITTKKAVQLRVDNFVGISPEEDAAVGLRDAETTVIAKGLDEVLRGIETGELSDDDITKVVRRYRDSNLSIAARVMRIVPLVAKSGLRDELKIEGAKVTTKLARLAAGGQIKETRALEIIDSLTDGRKVSIEELPNINIDDQKLISWLALVERNTSDYETSDQDLTDELQRIFETLPTVKTSGRTVSARRSGESKAGRNMKPAGRVPVSLDQIRSGIDRLPPELRAKALRELERHAK